MKRQTERKSERPRKCLQGASQEEVPVAITTAVAPVAMGTSRVGKTASGQQGQTNSVLPFLREGKTRRNYLKQHSLFLTCFFTLSIFLTLNPTCERNALSEVKKNGM